MSKRGGPVSVHPDDNGGNGGIRLLIDLGNTRLKWALARGGHLDSRTIVAESDWLSRLPDLMSQWCRLGLDEIVFASVVEQTITERVLACLASMELPLRQAATEAIRDGVRCAYRQPQRLGVDRWLALLAAHRDDRRRRQLVVSAGSALTLDLLLPGGEHAGGLIAPGLVAMRAGLLAAAPVLAVYGEGRESLELAADSGDAIASGCLQSALALIERCRRLPSARVPCRVLLAGGDATRLAPWLSPPVRLRPHLVLEGLAWWARSAP